MPLEVGSLPFLESKIYRSVHFQPLDPNFVWALEPTILKLEGSSFGNGPSIYVLKGWYYEIPKNIAIAVILGAKAFLAPSPRYRVNKIYGLG